MTDIVHEVVQEVERLTDDLVEMCRELVKINTVNPYAGAEPTGLEKDGQEFIQPILEGMGGKTRLFEPPPDIYKQMGVIGPKGRSWQDRPNLVTEFDLGPGRRIVLNSHMDTVGAAGMAFDPFCADVKDGKIYGRGSSDDKGGMAMGIIAIKAALKFSDALSGTVVHQSVVDEECSGSGAGTLACVLEGYTGDEAVVIDGSELIVMRGCQGCLTADVKIHGRSGHAARGGVNAIDKALVVKGGIDRFKAEREAKYPDCLVNLGVFNAGVHPAVVPGSATLSLNMVYRIEEAVANDEAGFGWGGLSVRDAFEDAIHTADESDEWLREHPSNVEWVKDLVPFETPENTPLLQDIRAAHETALGRAPEVKIMSAWADGANLAQYGRTPTVLFGPGTKNAAHSDDETVAIRDLIDGAKVIAAYLCRQLDKRS
ncbi:MAG: M20/M25/M40 family metallo-hydrolase [Planctomycetes bacterium]|nr:M20/M25/M40 family metallo-hydrolase [Planctomycetota bacterium]